MPSSKEHAHKLDILLDIVGPTCKMGCDENFPGGWRGSLCSYVRHATAARKFANAGSVSAAPEKPRRRR